MRSEDTIIAITNLLPGLISPSGRVGREREKGGAGSDKSQSPDYFFRSVLTRAELDALPLDNNVKQDVERGKVSKDNELVVSSRLGVSS